MDVLDLLRPEVRALAAYSVPDAKGLIKLDAMENPYSWPDTLRQGWLELLALEPVNRYPEPAPAGLLAALRAATGIYAGTGIVLGNGSDELIQILALALRRDRSVLAPLPTFVMYRLIAQTVGLEFTGVPLRDDFTLDMAAMRIAIARTRPGLLFLSYPNNPTGNLFAEEDVEELISLTPGWVVIDEAYFPFARKSFMGALSRHPNLLVLRTLSKEGLAGLRFGFLAGPATLIAELDKLRLPYNINRLTQRSVEFALAHARYFAEQAESVVRERGRVTQALQRHAVLTVFPSDANFILFRAPEASHLWEWLRSQGVLIKNMAGSGLPGYLRATVGTPTENDCFLTTLSAGLNGIAAGAA